MSVTEAEPRLQQLWMWWLSIDQTMQQVLDDISVLAPQAVAQVLGGPDEALLTAPQGTKFSEHLWAQLGAGNADYEEGGQRPHVVLAGGFRVRTPHAAPGADLDFEWEEANQGGSARSPEDERHRALVMIQDQTGAVIASQEEMFGTPGPGETAARAIVISGLSEGSYWAKLFTPYQDGMESTPGAEAAPAIQFQVGQADANDLRGADNLDTMLWAIAERFVAASELAAARDPQMVIEVHQAVNDLNELLVSVGAQPVLSGRGFGGLQFLDPTVVHSELGRASSALGRFAERAGELLREGQALNDSRDLTDFEAALAFDNPAAAAEPDLPDHGGTDAVPDEWPAQVSAVIPPGGLGAVHKSTADRPGGISEQLASGAETYRSLLELIGADTAVLDRIIASSSVLHDVTTANDDDIERIDDLLEEVEDATGSVRSKFPDFAAERRNLVATQEAQDLLAALASLAINLESWR